MLDYCWRHAVALACASVALSIGIASAQEPESTIAAGQLPVLKQLTMEELLNVDVTLPLRRPERASESAAAVSVLTREDIWRSGAVVLPEVLRAAPGLFVGRLSATSWIITSRGFASTAANKMLVMIDGRSVYSPLFAGVFWDQIDYPLADLDRIEVVRGPGASLWGSNAVNGVINIVSKPASETQGTLASGGTGAEEHAFGSIRHGGRVGAGYYRVYGKFTARDDGHLADGSAANDWQRVGRAGTRIDLGTDDDGLTLQGEVVVSRSGLTDRRDLEASAANVLAQWRRRVGSRQHLELQAYYDRTARLVPSQFEEVRDTYNAELQHRIAIGSRNAFTWGGGYRLSRDDTTPTVLLRFEPEDRTTDQFSAFVQDEFTVLEDVVVTGGVRLEHNDYSGIETQPTARVRWMPDTTQTVWAGISRAVRLPTRFDTDIRVLAGSNVVITGNPAFAAERVVGVEAGYRVSPLEMLSGEISLFRNRYDDLRSQEPRAGEPVLLGNGLNVTSSGLELTGRMQPRDWLRLTASYSRLSLSRSLDITSADPTGGRGETIDPEHQLFLQARLDLPRSIEFDTHVRYVSELPNAGTPDYTEASLRVAWRPRTNLELAVIGRDLLEPQHFEFISPTSSRRTALERAVFTRISVAF